MDSFSDVDPARDLRGVARQLASGVAVVISLAADGPHAATATTFVPVSYRPPLVAVCFAVTSRMRAHLERSRRFSVSLLGADDHTLARHFSHPARATGWAGLERMGLLRRDPAPPVLSAAIAWVDCALDCAIELGDHVCLIGSVLATARQPEAAPLVAYRGRFHRLGACVAPASWTTYEDDDWLAQW